MAPRSRPPLTRARAVAATAADPAAAGFFLDFDGTLAPIQLDPESVRPVSGAAEALARLTRLVARVAIVSARPVAFLRERLSAVSGLTLHGLYGLERLGPDGELVTDPEAEAWLPAVREAAGRAVAELGPSLRVEDKRLAVALHYRGRPELRPAVEQWARRQSEALGLRVQEGRMVLELRPPVDRDKGHVLREEAPSLGCAWYAGDDLSDLKAFAALRELEAAGGFTGVCVAVRNPETGERLAEAADLVLDAPAAVPGLLEQVAAALER